MISTDFVEKSRLTTFKIGQLVFVSILLALCTKIVRFSEMSFLFARIHTLSIVLFIAAVCLISISCGRGQRENHISPSNVATSESAININTATAKQLETLPYIGKTLSQRIVDFREKNGRLPKPQLLLMVPGIIEKRVRQMRELIRIDVRRFLMN